MSSYDTWRNLLSGISQGSFDETYVKDSNGAMTDILKGFKSHNNKNY